MSKSIIRKRLWLTNCRFARHPESRLPSTVLPFHTTFPRFPRYSFQSPNFREPALAITKHLSLLRSQKVHDQARSLQTLARPFSLVPGPDLSFLKDVLHCMNNMDWGKQDTHIHSSLPGIAVEQPFSNKSRPEAHMVTASQLRGATPVGGYSWRVCLLCLRKCALADILLAAVSSSHPCTASPRRPGTCPACI